jgi:PAS domain S-box-containing protein
MADLAGKAIFANEGARRMVGAPDGFDWAEATVLDFFLPEDRAFVAAEVLPELTAGRGWAGEMRFRHFATGEPVPVWYDAFPIKDGAGRVAALATVARGIGERKRAEARLRESEARFRHLADSAPALIWMTDAEGRVTFANMHYDHLFGRPAAEMLGRGWEGIVLPEDLERHYGAFLEAFHARSPFRTETRVRDKAGQVRWLRCEGVPRLDDAGAFLGYTGCNVDITDAKAAEAALREGEARFRAITDSIDPMVWSTRPDGFHDYYNQRWYDYTGVPRGSTDGEAWNGVFHPEDQERAWADLAPQPRHGRALPDRVPAAAPVRPVPVGAGPGAGRAGRGRPGHALVRHLHRHPGDRGGPRGPGPLGRGAGARGRRSHRRVAEGRGRAPAVAEDGGGGPAHRRRGARLQQPAHHHPLRLRPAAAARPPGGAAAALRGRHRGHGRARVQDHGPAPGLRAPAGAQARGVRRGRPRPGGGDMLRTIMGSRTRIATEIACERCLVEADASQFETALVNMAVNARDAMGGEGTLTVRVEGVPRMPPIRGHGGGAGAFVAVSLADTGAGIVPDELARISSRSSPPRRWARARGSA